MDCGGDDRRDAGVCAALAALAGGPEGPAGSPRGDAEVGGGVERRARAPRAAAAAAGRAGGEGAVGLCVTVCVSPNAAGSAQDDVIEERVGWVGRPVVVVAGEGQRVR